MNSYCETSNASLILKNTGVMMSSDSLCYLRAVCPLASYLPSLCFGFLFCKMGIILIGMSSKWINNASSSE